jgi:carboxyl-terminal processing protease
MKRRIFYGVVVTALVVNLFVGARIFLSTAHAADGDSAYPSLELFAFVMDKVRKDYVDGQNLTYQDLVHGALKGMLSTLDPHSEFMDGEKFKELQDDTQGAFGGLGIVISIKDNYVTVITPMDDSPGLRAGIQTGDRILKIDGHSTEKLGLEDAVKTLRGEPGSEVNLTVMRPGSGQVKEYHLTRQTINVDMVKDINGKKDFPLSDNKIGYVRLMSFGERVGDDLETALRKMNHQGMQGLVLDLRWNPGGLLDQAVAVCQKFLPRGELIVTTEGRSAAQNVSHRAMGHGDELHNMPIVVLVNSSSASASEIVAGCLQDLKRAVLLGEKTFGKGSVQSILPLSDGTALRLTTAKYYTPSHKVIHEHGIVPDVPVSLTDEEERNIQIRRSPGGIESLDEKEQAETMQTGDPQLERAMDLLKGIILFAQRAPAPAPEKRIVKGEKVATIAP